MDDTNTIFFVIVNKQMKTTTKWQNHKLVPVTTLNSALVSTVQATDNEWLGLLIVLCVF